MKDLDRIASALERIAAAIESQNENAPGWFFMLSNRIEELSGCIPGLPEWIYDYEPPKARPLVTKKKPQYKPRSVKKPGLKIVSKPGEKND